MGQRAEGHNGGFTAARVACNAAYRAVGDHQFILGIIPGRIRINRIPKEFEAETASAGKKIFHLLGDWALFERVVIQVDIEGAVGITALDRSQLIVVFCQQAVGCLHFFYGFRRCNHLLLSPWVKSGKPIHPL